jgi:hypothetical protein
VALDALLFQLLASLARKTARRFFLFPPTHNQYTQHAQYRRRTAIDNTAAVAMMKAALIFDRTLLILRTVMITQPRKDAQSRPRHRTAL